jgi:hypothetical protein
MRNDISIPPEEPRPDAPSPEPTPSRLHETDPLPREAKTGIREARNTDTHLVNPAEKEHLTHPTMDPTVEMAARRGDEPDVSTYNMPASMRWSGSDLTMSAIILIIAVVTALIIFLFMFFRK